MTIEHKGLLVKYEYQVPNAALACAHDSCSEKDYHTDTLTARVLDSQQMFVHNELHDIHKEDIEKTLKYVADERNSYEERKQQLQQIMAHICAHSYESFLTHMLLAYEGLFGNRFKVNNIFQLMYHVFMSSVIDPEHMFVGIKILLGEAHTYTSSLSENCIALTYVAPVSFLECEQGHKKMCAIHAYNGSKTQTCIHMSQDIELAFYMRFSDYLGLYGMAEDILYFLKSNLQYIYEDKANHIATLCNTYVLLTRSSAYHCAAVQQRDKHVRYMTQLLGELYSFTHWFALHEITDKYYKTVIRVDPICLLPSALSESDMRCDTFNMILTEIETALKTYRRYVCGLPKDVQDDYYTRFAAATNSPAGPMRECVRLTFAMGHTMLQAYLQHALCEIQHATLALLSHNAPCDKCEDAYTMSPVDKRDKSVIYLQRSQLSVSQWSVQHNTIFIGADSVDTKPIDVQSACSTDINEFIELELKLLHPYRYVSTPPICCLRTLYGALLPWRPYERRHCSAVENSEPESAEDTESPSIDNVNIHCGINDKDMLPILINEYRRALLGFNEQTKKEISDLQLLTLVYTWAKGIHIEAETQQHLLKAAKGAHICKSKTRDDVKSNENTHKATVSDANCTFADYLHNTTSPQTYESQAQTQNTTRRNPVTSVPLTTNEPRPQQIHVEALGPYAYKLTTDNTPINVLLCDDDSLETEEHKEIRELLMLQYIQNPIHGKKDTTHTILQPHKVFRTLCLQTLIQVDENMLRNILQLLRLYNYTHVSHTAFKEEQKEYNTLIFRTNAAIPFTLQGKRILPFASIIERQNMVPYTKHNDVCVHIRGICEHYAHMQDYERMLVTQAQIRLLPQYKQLMQNATQRHNNLVILINTQQIRKAHSICFNTQLVHHNIYMSALLQTCAHNLAAHIQIRNNCAEQHNAHNDAKATVEAIKIYEMYVMLHHILHTMHERIYTVVHDAQIDKPLNEELFNALDLYYYCNDLTCVAYTETLRYYYVLQQKIQF